MGVKSAGNDIIMYAKTCASCYNLTLLATFDNHSLEHSC